MATDPCSASIEMCLGVHFGVYFIRIAVGRRRSNAFENVAACIAGERDTSLSQINFVFKVFSIYVAFNLLCAKNQAWTRLTVAKNKQKQRTSFSI